MFSHILILVQHLPKAAKQDPKNTEDNWKFPSILPEKKKKRKLWLKIPNKDGENTEHKF